MQTIKKIYVRSEDLGVFTQEEVTVVIRDENNEIVYCNHAGSNTESVENSYFTSDGRELEYMVDITTCDKCEAWKKDDGLGWEDQPIGGIHE